MTNMLSCAVSPNTLLILRVHDFGKGRFNTLITLKIITIAYLNT